MALESSRLRGALLARGRWTHDRRTHPPAGSVAGQSPAS